MASKWCDNCKDYTVVQNLTSKLWRCTVCGTDGICTICGISPCACNDSGPDSGGDSVTDFWCNVCQSYSHNTEDCPYSEFCTICSEYCAIGHYEVVHGGGSEEPTIECTYCGGNHYDFDCPNLCHYCMSYPCICPTCSICGKKGHEYDYCTYYCWNCEGNNQNCGCKECSTCYSLFNTNKDLHCACESPTINYFDKDGKRVHTDTVYAHFSYTVRNSIHHAGYEDEKWVTANNYAGWTPGKSWTMEPSWWNNHDYGFSENEAGFPELNLYWQGTQIKYEIIYNCNDGFVDSSYTIPNNFTYGQTGCEVIPSDKITKRGFRFVGWTDSKGNDWTDWSGTWSGEAGDTVWGIDSNNKVYLTAQWKEVYTIFYDTNEGTITSTRSLTDQVEYGQDYAVISNTEISRSGYKFLYWTTNGETLTHDGYNWSYTDGSPWSGEWTWTAGNYGISNDGYRELHLYAAWEPEVYTITYNANGGSCSTTSKTVTYNSSYGTLPTPTRTGYRFTGWYTQATGGTEVTSYTTVETDSNHVLFAHWEIVKYTVTYHGNGGTYGNSTSWEDPTKATYGADYKVWSNNNFFVRSGYNFTGWKDQDGTEWEIGQRVWNATKNINLYAQWETENYKLYFNANEGTNTNSGNFSNNGCSYGDGQTNSYVKVTYGSTAYSRMSDSIPVRAGYKFLGWYTSRTSDDEQVYDANGIAVPNSVYWNADSTWKLDLGDPSTSYATVYAHWEPLATIFTKVGNEYKPGITYVKTQDGVWKQGAAVYIKTNDGWKISVR